MARERGRVKKVPRPVSTAPLIRVVMDELRSRAGPD